MKKLRDIIYDYNDVVVALLIVVAAGLIIFWRVNTVMAYPSQVTAHSASPGGIEVNFNDVDLTPEDVDPQVVPGTDPTEISGSAIEPATGTAIEPSTGSAVVEPGSSEGAVTPPPASKRTLVISKANKNGNWQAVGNWLVDNGIIADKAKFIARVSERKVDKKLKLGTFEFNTGMTLDEVIDKLIK